MQSQQRGVAVAVFPDISHAVQAVEELRRNGFAPDQIGYVAADEQARVEVAPLEHGSKAVEGAAAGVTAGAALGGLVGAALGTVVLPGVGTVIAGGLLAGLLGGAATGAAGGGILGTLIGLNVPEEEAQHVERQFHSGQTIVTVQAGARYDEAAAILQRVRDTPEPKMSGRARARLASLAEGGDTSPGSGSPIVPRP